jgi:hypothetical protein
MRITIPPVVTRASSTEVLPPGFEDFIPSFLRDTDRQTDGLNRQPIVLCHFDDRLQPDLSRAISASHMNMDAWLLPRS